MELSAFEFLDSLADLILPLRKHRHRYHGMFAPNHRLRTAVTAPAIGNAAKQGDVTRRTSAVTRMRNIAPTTRRGLTRPSS